MLGHTPLTAVGEDDVSRATSEEQNHPRLNDARSIAISSEKYPPSRSRDVAEKQRDEAGPTTAVEVIRDHNSTLATVAQLGSAAIYAGKQSSKPKELGNYLLYTYSPEEGRGIATHRNHKGRGDQAESPARNKSPAFRPLSTVARDKDGRI